ncbi:hypothetical protein GCM10029964_043550 [Kibdelosporangium lantanae]
MALRVRPRVRTGVALAAAVGTMCAAFSTSSSADPSAAPGAADPPAPVTVSLKNDCVLPVGGKQLVTTDLTAQLPKTAVAGDAVGIDEVKVKFTIPEATVKALRDNGVASLEGVAFVGVGIDDKHVARIQVTILKTPLPDKGDLVVEQTGKLTPELKAGRAGRATVTVQPLEVMLVPRNPADELLNAEARKVTCALEDGQDAKLGVLTVIPPKADEPSESNTPSSTAPPSSEQQPGKKKDPHKPKVHALDAERCAVMPDPNDPDNPVSVIWTYYPLNSDVTVNNLQGTVHFDGYMSAALTAWSDGQGGVCNFLDGTLLWPPAAGNFIAYHFLPTGSEVTITQPTPAHGELDKPVPGAMTATANTIMTLNVATVNGAVRLERGPDGKLRPIMTGTPLAVGTHCQAPVTMNLVSDPDKWNPAGLPDDPENKAGVIEADFAIGNFTGCGVTEDLDPLLKGLLGDKGHVTLNFGAVTYCFTVPDYPGDGPCAPDPNQPPQQQQKKG